MIGKSVQHYRILSQLGSGGMGVVYEAIDQRLDRRVALKFLPDRMAEDSLALDRFLLEARTASSLSHPGICTIFDLGDFEGRPFIVMELLKGMTVRQSLEKGPIEVPTVLQLAAQVLDALGAAHRRAIIHRDIKPENLFISEEMRVKVLDFGLAKPMQDEMSDTEQTRLTSPGFLVGTVAYMSPEQVRGESVDVRTDLYSLGMTLYEMATGVLPTRAESSAASVAAILKDPIPSLNRWKEDLPAELDRFILRSVAKRAEDRFESAERMLDSLRDVQRSLEPSTVQSESATSGPEPGPTWETAVAALVGREKEVDLFRGYLERVRQGRGGVVLVEGEPGIGKTILIEEVERLARQGGFDVATGRCSELDGSPPYLPLAEVVEDLLRSAKQEAIGEKLEGLGSEIARLTPRVRMLLSESETPMKVPPEQERYLLFSSLTDFFERLSRDLPMLLILEDLHWLDHSSSQYLQFLASRINVMSLLVVGSVRPSVVAQGGEVEISRHLREKRQAELVKLEPLKPKDLGSLLQSRLTEEPPPQLIEGIYNVTEGNPFFADEMIRLLLDEGRLFDREGRWLDTFDFSDLQVPEGVRLVLAHRLERLTDKTHQLLQQAALMGRSFRSELLEKLVDQNSDPDFVLESLEEAEEAGLVSSRNAGGGVEFSFCHALIGQTLVEEISLLRRRRWHLKIAEVIDRHFIDSNPEMAGQLAHHLAGAGSLADFEKRVEAIVKAAEQALGRTAFEESIRLYTQALQDVSHADRRHAELLFKKGVALTGLGEWKKAQEVWREALPLFEEEGNFDQVGEICNLLAAQSVWTGRLEEAERISRRGLRSVRDSRTVTRCRLEGWAGNALNQKGYLDSGSRLTSGALEMARNLNDEALLGNMMTHRACQAFYSMDSRTQAEIGLQAIERLGHRPWELVEAMVMTQLGLLGKGEISRAKDMVERLMNLGQKIGHLGSLWMGKRVLGICEFVETGDVERLRQFAREDLETCRQAGIRWISESYVWLGQASFLEGDFEDAEELFREASRMEPDDFTSGFDSSFHHLILAYLGKPERPLQEYQKLAEADAGELATTGYSARILAAVEGSMVLERPELTGAYYTRVRRLSELGNVIRFNGSGLVETMAGVAAAAGGAWEAAEEHFQRALEQAETLPYRLEQVETRRWWASMLLRRSRPEDLSRARQLAAEAIPICEELGLSMHQRIIGDLLHRTE